MRAVPLFALMASLLAGCSAVPDVTYSYYPAKSQTLVSVSQTLDCTTDKTSLIVLNTPSAVASYSADLTKPPYQIRIKDVEGFFSPFVDSDITFAFYDDGRLKSINQSTTGQGEAVIKSAVSLATALGGAAPAVKGATLPICDKINNWGKGKPVTLTYSTTVDLATKLGQTIPLPIAPASRQAAAAIGDDPAIPKLGVQIGTAPAVASGPSFPATSQIGDYVSLPLQRSAAVRVDITASGSSIWTGIIAVPLSESYILPIPRAALFGGQNFSLALNEAGVVTSVDYGKKSGVSGALNAAGAVATAEQPESPAAKAADLKAQADIIAQQQRLTRCRANPSTCQ
jgi:hypothetical protein